MEAVKGAIELEAVHIQRWWQGGRQSMLTFFGRLSHGLPRSRCPSPGISCAHNFATLCRGNSLLKGLSDGMAALDGGEQQASGTASGAAAHLAPVPMRLPSLP